MKVEEANRRAWNAEVERKNFWTLPAKSELVEKARKGDLEIYLTPDHLMEKSWYQHIQGRVLALASAGGQQAPLFAAMGADTTVYDMSDKQLANDTMVAKREGLKLRVMQGDMRDLSPFKDEEFDTIFNPVSLNFVPDPAPVFKESFRTLKSGGYFFTAFANPALYMFNEKKLEKGKMKIRYTLPFSDTKSISRKKRKEMIENHDTLEFSHTLQSLLGGICDAGFIIKGFKSDTSSFEPIDSYLKDCYLAIMAQKP